MVDHSCACWPLHSDIYGLVVNVSCPLKIHLSHILSQIQMHFLSFFGVSLPHAYQDKNLDKSSTIIRWVLWWFQNSNLAISYKVLCGTTWRTCCKIHTLRRWDMLTAMVPSSGTSTRSSTLQSLFLAVTCRPWFQLFLCIESNSEGLWPRSCKMCDGCCCPPLCWALQSAHSPIPECAPWSSVWSMTIHDIHCRWFLTLVNPSAHGYLHTSCALEHWRAEGLYWQRWSITTRRYGSHH